MPSAVFYNLFLKKIVKRGKNTTKQTPTKPNTEPIQVQLLHTQTANNKYITAPGRAETEKHLNATTWVQNITRDYCHLQMHSFKFKD